MSSVLDTLPPPPAHEPRADSPTTTASPILSPSPVPVPSGRLLFLDGMRGLASIYIVLHHACQTYQDADAQPRYGYYPFIPWLLRGRAVAVFMVLSGFCLMLPV